jgi:hypothetical protein
VANFGAGCGPGQAGGRPKGGSLQFSVVPKVFVASAAGVLQSSQAATGHSERERERARERERYLPAASERHQSASAVLLSSRHVGGVERAGGVLGKDPGGVVEERVGEGSETTVCALPTTCCRCFGFCSGGLSWEKL